MKFLSFLTIFAIVFNLHSSSQKKILDSTAIENWIELGDANISENGKYVFYIVKNTPRGAASLVVKSLDGKLTKQFTNVSSCQFSNDSKFLYFLQNDNRLILLKLLDFTLKTKENISRFELLEYGNDEHILCAVDGENKKITMLTSGIAKKEFDSFNSFWMDKHDPLVVVQREIMVENSKVFELHIWSPEKNDTAAIWRGEEVTSVAFGKSGMMAFVIEGKELKRKMILYNTNTLKGKDITLRDHERVKQFSLLPDRLSFNKNGTLLFYSIRSSMNKERMETKRQGVIIWNHKDDLLKSQEEADRGRQDGQIFSVYYDTISEETSILEENNESPSFVDARTGSLCLIMGQVKQNAYYKTDNLPYLRLVRMGDSTSSINIIPKGTTNFRDAMICPNEKFVVWFNYDSLQWFSYEIETGAVRNLTSSYNVQFSDEIGRMHGKLGPWGFCAWMPLDNSILVYDRTDIWKISLFGGAPPICVTNHFGAKNGITLNLVFDDNEVAIVDPKSSIIISGYNMRTKEGGYWFLKFPEIKTKLTTSHLQPFSVTSRMPIGNYRSANGKIVKARSRNLFLIVRESATESRNVYISSDLARYSKVSDIHPEREYFWMTVKLLSWKKPNGDLNQGILYLPEVIDSVNKLPVIFNYYEKRSDGFHEFISPEFSRDNINIPMFVANGFAVFVPDIDTRPGYNGQGAYNCINSGADLISKLGFLDSTKFGLQGHSFGGWITNYMISHSTRFAAACEAAGVADQVSAYGQIGAVDGAPRQSFYETFSQGSPYGIGVTPWTRSDLYIENSPVFRIGQVQTPLLMMHNRKDRAVPFDQAIEMFTGLKRAGKSVWLLEYEGHGHSVYGAAAQDYHIKMLQFFNHFLKGKPAPSWL